MKQKLIYTVQNLVFLALIGAGVVDYSIAIKEGKSPLLNSAHLETISKSPIWSGLIHCHILGAILISMNKDLENSKPILNVEHVDASIFSHLSAVDSEKLNLVHHLDKHPFLSRDAILKKIEALTDTEDESGATAESGATTDTGATAKAGTTAEAGATAVAGATADTGAATEATTEADNGSEDKTSLEDEPTEETIVDLISNSVENKDLEGLKKN